MNADSIEVQQDGLSSELLQQWLSYLWLLWHLALHYFRAPRAAIPSETADESATSGPGHTTTMGGGNDPLGSQEEGEEGGAVASTPPGAEQIPDADLTFGRETSTLGTPTAGQQGLNNSIGNGTTDGGLENPLGENITSLTGT